MPGQATVTANGTDDIFDVIHNFWGRGVDDRLSPLLQQAGYQVLNLEVDSSIDLWKAIGSLTYPYQVRLKVETGTLPNTLDAVKKVVSDAMVQATGYAPTSIAVTSAGQSAPTAPAGPIDKVITGVENIGLTAVTGVQVITAAVAIGVVVLIYWAVKNPKAARGLV
jgi:hypothetical protein